MPLALTLSDAANLATIFSTLITLVATVIGAVWVVHTWRRQERLRTENEILQTHLRKEKEALDARLRKEEEDLRQQKENPGLEIHFACQQHPLPDGRILLTLDYAVRNTGVIPIYPDITKASYSIGEIPLDSVSGFLTRSVSVEGKVEIPCRPVLVDCVLSRRPKRFSLPNTWPLRAIFMASRSSSLPRPGRVWAALGMEQVACAVCPKSGTG